MHFFPVFELTLYSLSMARVRYIKFKSTKYMWESFGAFEVSYRGFLPYATFGTWKKFALAKFLFYVRSNKINSL